MAFIVDYCYHNHQKKSKDILSALRLSIIEIIEGQNCWEFKFVQAVAQI